MSRFWSGPCSAASVSIGPNQVRQLCGTSLSAPWSKGLSIDLHERSFRIQNPPAPNRAVVFALQLPICKDLEATAEKA